MNSKAPNLLELDLLSPLGRDFFQMCGVCVWSAERNKGLGGWSLAFIYSFISLSCLEIQTSFKSISLQANLHVLCEDFLVFLGIAWPKLATWWGPPSCILTPCLLASSNGTNFWSMLVSFGFDFLNDLISLRELD